MPDFPNVLEDQSPCLTIDFVRGWHVCSCLRMPLGRGKQAGPYIDALSRLRGWDDLCHLIITGGKNTSEHQETSDFFGFINDNLLVGCLTYISATR